MTRLSLGLCLFAAACGEPSATAFTATVRMDALLADEVQDLALHVFGPKRTDGVFLTCGNLMDRVIAPADTRLDSLGSLRVALADLTNQSVELDSISAGSYRILYGEATDASSTVLANGCTDRITVASGKTTEVPLDLFGF